MWCGVVVRRLQDPATPLSMQHYRGIYMLQEKVSRDKQRVNVAKFNATEDMTGGHMGTASWPAAAALLAPAAAAAGEGKAKRRMSQSLWPPQRMQTAYVAHEPDKQAAVNNRRLHAAVAAGGYLVAYENDNIEQGEVLLVTRLSKLTMLLEYPDVGPEDPVVMWIQQ